MNKLYETERLILRSWREEDKEPFANLNADPRVMEYFVKPLTREESDAMIERMNQQLKEQGFTFFAMEEKASHKLVGFTGLRFIDSGAPFAPAVEIGWRMAFEFWGKGYAVEAARKCLEIGFTEFHLKEIVSFTVPANLRSRAVMERLGMTRDPADDFDHPRVPEGHPLKRHVLYRKRAHES